VHASFEAVFEGSEAAASGEDLGFDYHVFEGLTGCKRWDDGESSNDGIE
jgi:hypothetical protein